MNTRHKRLRTNSIIRALVQETALHKDDLVYPLFIEEGQDIKTPISSMSGMFRFSIDRVGEEIEEALCLGINKFLLFGIPKQKDENGVLSLKEDTIIYQAIKHIKTHYPNTYVITDVCFCEYTTHGHCGILKNGHIDNDATLKLIANQALLHAKAGVDMVAPSGMADGMVLSIRTLLDKEGYIQTPIMSYSAKYFSSFYGPFRDGVDSAPSMGDRSSYQMDMRNSKEAIKEMQKDIDESADIIMVKPAMNYLDIIQQASHSFLTPIAAYQVSGEYSLIKQANQLSMDTTSLMLESLIAIKRAGAKIIITYFAKDVAKLL